MGASLLCAEGGRSLPPSGSAQVPVGAVPAVDEREQLIPTSALQRLHDAGVSIWLDTEVDQGGGIEDPSRRAGLCRAWAVVDSQAMDACSHLDQVQVLDLPDPVKGCAVCLKIGGEWVHLRMCQTCGVIGCCDS